MSDVMLLVKERVLSSIKGIPCVSLFLSFITFIGGILGFFDMSHSFIMCPTLSSWKSLLFPFVNLSVSGTILAVWLILSLSMRIESSRGSIFLFHAFLFTYIGISLLYGMTHVIVRRIPSIMEALPCSSAFCFTCTASTEAIIMSFLIIEPIATNRKYRYFPGLTAPVPVLFAPFIAWVLYACLYTAPVLFPLAGIIVGSLYTQFALSIKTQRILERSFLGSLFRALPNNVSSDTADRTRPILTVPSKLDIATHTNDVDAAADLAAVRTPATPTGSGGSFSHSAEESPDDDAVLLSGDSAEHLAAQDAVLLRGVATSDSAASLPTKSFCLSVHTGAASLVYPELVQPAPVSPNNNRGAALTAGVTEAEFDRSLGNLVRLGYHAVAAKRALLLSRGNEERAVALLRGAT